MADKWVNSMYGDIEPHEKNINRVLAGMKASGVTNPGMTSGTPDRYVQALEIKIKLLDEQIRKLTKQNNQLTSSYNKVMDRVNAITRKLNL